MTRKLTKIFQQGNNCSIFQLLTKMSIKLSFLDNCRYYISAIQNINDLCLNKIAYSIEIIIKRKVFHSSVKIYVNSTVTGIFFES